MAKRSKKNTDHGEPGHLHVMTLREVFFKWLDTKNRKVLTKQPIQGNGPLPQPNGIQINYIAVVLDGRVEEVIRAENRLAALFLSNPTFIEFSPDGIRPTIGWGYDGEKFTNPNETHKED
jgi:hypothetical protein